MKTIYDTNVVINSINGGVFDEIFYIGHQLSTTEENIFELANDPKKLELLKKKIKDKKISLIASSETIKEKASELERKHRENLSVADREMLACCKVLDFNSIATDDHPLTVVCSKEKVKTYWIGDLLKFIVDRDIISHDDALIAFEKIYKTSPPKWSRDLWPCSVGASGKR